MNIKSVWYLVGLILLIGLGGLAISCGMIEPSSPPLPTATIVPPLVPHSIESRADCRACHAEGIGGAPQFPVATHRNRPSDVCFACHDLASTDKGSDLLKVPYEDRNAFPYFDNGENRPPSTTPTEIEETTAPLSLEGSALAAALGKETYGSNCSACHGASREGIAGFAPALTPESLATLSDIEIKDVILDGRSGTTMPAFKETLSPEEIDALLRFIKDTSP